MKVLVALTSMAVMLSMLSACQQEGPAERAGKQADQAMEKLGQQVEKAGAGLQEAAKGERKK